ncbi:MAG: threonine synthase, partial [Dysgonamonadaceae bacterium]|nr:threonine synthase [Dysgonamonadaceae bacterium]
FKEIGYAVADAFFGEDIDPETLRSIVYETLDFDVPVVSVDRSIFALELFHGPTLAFKDVGARFMSRTLSYFIRKQGLDRVNVLVATSGDTGSAVANGFLGVDGIHVYVLYPEGKVSPIQECQFTTLGQNITAIEVDGAFDDCQALVKSAFMDEELTRKLQLTSANSINVARFLPQAFYYFYAYAQLEISGRADNTVFCVPSGNFGNITAGLFAKKMGLPIKRFIAANNKNDVFLEYLKTGEYKPRLSVRTVANAMDVGDPSNFARILDLYDNDYNTICSEINGYRYLDEDILKVIGSCYESTGYLLDPHGACGYLALKDGLKNGETGIFLETAHPAKFKETVDGAVNNWYELNKTGCPEKNKPEFRVDIPARLKAFMQGKKQSVELGKSFDAFKDYLLNV